MAAAIRDAVTPQVARATMQAASATDVTDQVGLVAAPTLVLHRRQMPQISAEVARSLAGQLPHGRLIMLEGRQPSLFMESPGSVVSTLIDFLCEGIEPAGTVPAQAAVAPRATRLAPPDGLTQRELEVLTLVAAGESNAQIARALGLSIHTVERHVANLYRKIGARGRADATAYAVRGGLA